jgi:N-acetylglucosaminyldiphosphoundecaprenol N-acetyl-beta-D-mannosaminyltransferase
MVEIPFPRVNVLGVGVHALNMEQAVNLLLDVVARRGKGYVCVTGVHGVMEAQRSPGFLRVLNHSLLTAPDGMPTVWLGRIAGHGQMGRVFGPDLMLNVCRESVSRGISQFLYGGAPGVAEELQQALELRFPGLRVVGTYTPPFRPLCSEERFEVLQHINTLRPDIIWVGLSTPKQERFMADSIDKFDTRLMLGVGAAFDLHTGRMTDSPEWVKKAGMQWAHRLVQDPRRLWKRYLVNNPQFLLAISAQLLGLRHYQLAPAQTDEPVSQQAVWTLLQ